MKLKKSLFLFLITLLLSSCADMMKKDQISGPAHPDEFTVGGGWPERGLFDAPNKYETTIPTKNKNGRGIASAQPSLDYDPGQDPESGWNPGSKYKNGNRAGKADFIDEGNEGSLWASEGQTNYFLVKNKVRSPGEIVTIKIDEPIVKEVETELKRTLTAEERQAEIDKIQAKFDYEKLVKEVRAGLKKDTQPKPEDEQAEAERRIAEAAKVIPDEFKEKTATEKDIDFSKEVPVKAGDNMMGEILDRYPNGNYRVRGTKRVYFRGNPRTLSFVGIVKSTEIDEKDQTETGKFYEYRLRVARQ